MTNLKNLMVEMFKLFKLRVIDLYSLNQFVVYPVVPRTTQLHQLLTIFKQKARTIKSWTKNLKGLYTNNWTRNNKQTTQIFHLIWAVFFLIINLLLTQNKVNKWITWRHLKNLTIWLKVGLVKSTWRNRVQRSELINSEI